MSERPQASARTEHTRTTACRNRVRVVAMSISLLWLLLAGRLVHLQWLRGETLAVAAEKQRLTLAEIPAKPGEILDRRGRVLATTISSPSLFIVPCNVEKAWKLVMRLSEAVDVEPDTLYERITRNRTKQFLWVKRRLSEDEAERVRQLDLDQSVWGFRQEYLRQYPHGSLAAHVLGIRDIDGKGQGGIEQSLHGLLEGKPGSWRLHRDAMGRVIHVEHDIREAPRPGQTVQLTIDAVIQSFVERELDKLVDAWKPRGACAIVVDPESGEVLALASRPTFNPNQPGLTLNSAWINRAIAASYEPGSTFKPFPVAWALDQNHLGQNDVFHCENGEYRMGRRVLHDHHPYGQLDVTGILAKSSNIGMAKIGERIGNSGLYEAAYLFGFGRPTGIALPGELAGTVRPLKEWNGYSTGSVPMGQEIAVTPIQLIMAFAALCNGGRLLSPQLIMESDSSHGSTVSMPPQLQSPTVADSVGRWLVREPLKEVVRAGTGRKARLTDYTVFGKTGTAQKQDPVRGGYSHRLHVSSFIGGAPVDNPRVVVLVIADEPTVGRDHYGGTIAAPAARSILQRTLIHMRVPTIADVANGLVEQGRVRN